MITAGTSVIPQDKSMYQATVELILSGVQPLYGKLEENTFSEAYTSGLRMPATDTSGRAFSHPGQCAWFLLAQWRALPTSEG